MMPNGRYMNVNDLPKNLVMKPTTNSSVTMNMGPAGSTGGSTIYPTNSNREGPKPAKSGQRTYIDANDWDDPAFGGGL